MAYVYRHIRIDKNEPFYIGVSNSNKSYYRADKKDRNNLWSKITSKTKYIVEILLDDLTWEQACEKEKEFIKLYGRINNNTGILSNLTDGGEGILGYTFSEEQRKKLSESHKGKPNHQLGRTHSEESKKKMSFSQKNKKPISEETRQRMRLASQSRDVGAHNRGKKQPIEVTQKIRLANIGKKRRQYTCPHCNLIGRGSAMKQWHFDKCKLK
jgi:hypothetical protein